MSDATKTAKAIKDLLRRNLEILTAIPEMKVTERGEDWIPLAMVERVMDACANNIAMMIPELAVLDRTVHALPSAIERWTEEWGQERDGSDLVRYVAEKAYAEGAKAERLTLSKEWELDRVADDVREACACMVDTLADREASQSATRNLSATAEDALRYAAEIIRETPVNARKA